MTEGPQDVVGCGPVLQNEVEDRGVRGLGFRVWS